jgi:formylglycine-generating enzyme required for sulfatase activity
VESGLNNTTTSVDFHPTGVSSDGCLDLIGNVWEWTDAESEQTDLEAGYAFVFGGSFRHESSVKDAIARTMLLQMNHYAYVGFRCAKDFQ